jgi:uncharacterized protein HemX
VSGEPWAFAAAIVAGLASIVAGWAGRERSKKVSNSVSLMEQIREWASQVQESERQCREDLNGLREDLDEERRLRHKLEGVVDTLKAEMKALRSKVVVIEEHEQQSDGE